MIVSLKLIKQNKVLQRILKMVRVKFVLANQNFEKKNTSRAFCLVRKQNDN